MHTRKAQHRVAALLLALLLTFGFLTVPAVYAEELLAVTEPVTEPEPEPEPEPLPPAPEGGLLEIEEIATPETGIMMLFDAPAPRAVLTEDIPVIESSILDVATNKVVLIDGNGTQTGYATLAEAMADITSGSGDCTLVFIKDYTMDEGKSLGTDMTAITTYTPNANSLTVTSTYKDDSHAEQQCTVTACNNNFNGDWNFRSTTTLVHHFSYAATACSRILACGNDLTMGSGITTSGTNIQLFVGGTGATTSDHGSLTVNSGNYNFAFAAGYKSGIYTGTSTVTLGGTATVGTLYVGGSGAKFSADSKVNICLDNTGVDANTVHYKNIGISGYSGAANGLTSDGTLDFTLVGVTRGGIDLTLNNNPAQTTLHTKGATTITGTITAGNLVVEEGTLTNNNTVTLTGGLTVGEGANYSRTGGNTTAASLTLEKNATISVKTPLTLTGDLTVGEGAAYTGDATSALSTANISLGKNATMTTLGAVAATGGLTLAEGATYERRAAGKGTGVQEVGGDLNVTGAGAKIKLFKATAADVPDDLVIGGALNAGGNTLNLSLCDAGGNEVASAHGDQLLNFTTTAKAGSSYTLEDSTGNTVFVLDGKVVVSDKDYPYPTYYEPVTGSIADLFKFEQLVGSNNTSTTQYRQYVLESGVWNVYATDVNGTRLTGTPLTEADLTKEHPLPNLTAPITDYNSRFGAMFRVDGIGAYRIAVAAATNAGSNYPGSTADSNTASGQADNWVNIENKGTKNASWALLEHANDSCTIHKAYLVMTTTIANSSLDNISRKNAEELLNTPMKLIAPDNAEMLSNGYLPKGTLVDVVGGTTAVEADPDKPTLLYHGSNEGKSTSLGEAMTVTDVTDFVKQHGYGQYYGVDIPGYNNDPDGAIAWRLIVIEEDASIQNLRKVGIQMGPISNQKSKVDSSTTIKLTLDGFTTPDPGMNFEGQLLMIGSDNLLKSAGTKGSNLHNRFSPNPNGTEDTSQPVVTIPIGSNDPTTTGVDRPIGDDGVTDYWSQGFMDHDGTRLTKSQVQPIRKNASNSDSMGLDLSLLTITNTENTSWNQDGAGGGGHNLYLLPQSPSVALYSNRDDDGIGYIDVMGLATEIAIPEFETEITHADKVKPETTGVDVVAGHTVVISGTAKNTTLETGNHVRGTFNTKVVVTVDPKLTVTNPDSITATFHDYHRRTETTEEKSVTGAYDETTRTITFDFGSDFDYTKAGETVPTWGTDVQEEDLKLFNSRDDRIEFSFEATTQAEPTIDNAEVEYNNTIGVWGHVLYQYDRFDETDDTRYAHDEDDFDTYLHDVTFTKVTSGDLSDPDKEFTFEVTILDENGDALAKGKVLKVVRDKLDSVPSAEIPKPPDPDPPGTLYEGYNKLTVGEDGKVTFTLKHGQTITLQNMPLGSIKVTETGADDYALSYNMTKHSSTVPETTVKPETSLTGNTTGDIAVDIKEAELTDPVMDYTFNFTNTKKSTPPTGVRTKALPFAMLALVLLAGLVLTTTQAVADYKRHKRG